MRIPLTVATVLLSGLTLAGAGLLLTDTDNSAGGPTATLGAPEGSTPLPAVEPGDAEQTALSTTGRGSVADVELDLGHRDDDPYGRDHWEVEVRDGATLLEVDVDAASGAVLENETVQPRSEVPSG